MPAPPPPLKAHEFWQDVHPPGSFALPEGGAGDCWPAALPDGRQVLLPVRVLPGDGRQAVASLILNQASFAVLDAIADALAEALRPLAPDIIVGVPTLGLPLAEAVARRLGHARMVALGTSRKFWYRDELSVPLSSITTPDQSKRLYLDPRMLPLLRDARVAVVDDVASSGRTLTALLALLGLAEIRPVVLAFAMLQSDRWRAALPPSPAPVLSALSTPRLRRTDRGWLPEGTE